MTFEAPISQWQEPVQEAWVDYNGHMNIAYHTLIFFNAVDQFYEMIGLGQPYKETKRMTTFAVECHVGYQREVKLGDEVKVTIQLLGFDEKRLHYFCTMFHVTEGYQIATQEYLVLHVDLATKKVTSFSADPMEKMAELWKVHKDLPTPPQICGKMKIPSLQK